MALIRRKWLAAGFLSAVTALAAILVHLEVRKNDKPRIVLSGKELRGDDIRVSAFTRYMKIVRWDWPKDAGTASDDSEHDSAIYLDTIYLANPRRYPILWQDTTVVRGQVFIEYMSAPWQLLDQAEYRKTATNSKLEYEVLVAAPNEDAAPTWFIRQFRYVNTYQPENGRSQAGLRIPYTAELVSLVLDFGALPAEQRPLNASCRVRRPEGSGSGLVDDICPGAVGTSDSPVFAFTLTKMPAGSQVILEWSSPKEVSSGNGASK